MIVSVSVTANQALLRTLLSYCSLQGAAGGALASVRMELILLLQVCNDGAKCHLEFGVYNSTACTLHD